MASGGLSPEERLRTVFGSLIHDFISRNELSEEEIQTSLELLISKLDLLKNIHGTDRINKSKLLFDTLELINKPEIDYTQEQLDEAYYNAYQKDIDVARGYLDQNCSIILNEFEKEGEEVKEFVDDFLTTLLEWNYKIKITPLPKSLQENGSSDHLNEYFSKKQLQILFQYLEYEPLYTMNLISILWFFIEKGHNISFHKIDETIK
ncbi:MAG: hypothetical protein ACW99A_18705 [Candidatus Kariarchaeaceae archaeon]|jgi:hypothetical protein